ncbi:divergent polysaccharide deacetylase family protein [Salipiger sp.]|uniref:divergent polysaccharide deacetylase family protein n=1 Tax=Salipiger sp. TaxID=2078585 RepID=UPI003A9691E5
MAKGFVAGAIWGLVVSAVGAGTASVVMGPPAPRTPLTAAEEGVAVPVAEPSVPAEPAERDEGPDDAATTTTTTEKAPAPEPAAASAPKPEVAEAPAEPPVVPARRPVEESAQPETGAQPELGTPSAMPAGTAPDTAPGARPLAETDVTAGAAPEAPDASGARVAVETEAPVMPGAQVAAPEAPMVEAEPSISTDPAQPPSPSLPGETSGLAEAAPDAPAPEPAVTVTPEATTAPEAEPSAVAQAPEPGVPAIGKPAGSLIERGGAVPSGRLPSIGGGEAPESPDSAAAPAAGRPLDRYAAEVDLAEGVPHMAVVLIDDGSGPLGPDTIEAFPFPVSFAISPSHPDAAGAAREYRARGFEVLAISGAPAGAQASDVEVALEGALDAVPEAVAVLEDPSSGLQATRAVSEQAAGFLKASGHGLVMLPEGLNTAEAMARRAGVPAVTVFRDFDGDGQDPRVMRRFLDQAAFKARQEGGVVMLGRLRADTVSALLLWGLQDRASSVALVPVSVILKESEG